MTSNESLTSEGRDITTISVPKSLRDRITILSVALDNKLGKRHTQADVIAEAMNLLERETEQPQLSVQPMTREQVESLIERAFTRNIPGFESSQGTAGNE